MKLPVKLMNLRQTDRKYLARDDDAEDIEILRSEGSQLIAAKGKRYIDFFMGWNVGNLGWGNDEIRSRVRNFQGPDYVYPGYLYKPWAELAELLASITPGKLQKTFRATGGTEAVDFALRMAMVYTGRSRFISVKQAYHGDSIAALAVAGWLGDKIPRSASLRSHPIHPPLDSQAVGQVEKLLKTRKFAALIMEPISCNLNVLIPTDDFMMRIQHLCRKHGTLLILDEVACGFGRTGKLFATEHFGVEPDILCLAKAITGGYVPMGATMATEEVAKSLENEGNFYSTFGWHPLAVEAALANVGYLARNREKILAHVNEMGRYFLERLSTMDFRQQAKIHMKGLAIAVEFESGNLGSQIVERAKKKGLLLTGDSNSFSIFPALNIDKETATRGLDILEESCESCRALAA